MLLTRGPRENGHRPAVDVLCRSAARARAGADDYLVKPFATQQLLARVRTHHELAKLREYALNTAEDKVANVERALSGNRRIGLPWAS